MLLGIVPGKPAVGQPYGLDAPVPVAPFLDGVFPTRAPQGSLGWTVTPAFPDLAPTVLPTALVIASNPADDRVYVGSLDGQIISFENDPSVAESKPFMDLRDRVASVADGGFLGMVFHPEFGQAGSPYALTFFAYFASYCPTNLATTGIDFGACNPDYPRGGVKGYFNTWLRLSRFTAVWDPVDQVYKGDPTSESPLINIRLYNDSHRGGGPVFGHDGLLYLAIGDQFRYETAQDIAATLEGGTLRIAVDVTENTDGTWICPVGSHLPRRRLQEVTGNPDEMTGMRYCIPDDNPWVDPTGGVMEEYWAIGQRNPHRITVDTATGRIWSGEIGELTREEVNVIESGRNYGWPFREGLLEGVRPVPASYIGVLTDPVIDFTREEASSIIGGYVYRGSAFPELVGRYLAGDWATRNIWAIDLDPASMTATKELLTTFTPGSLATFGQDNAGEVLLGSVSLEIPLQHLERVGVGVPDPPPRLSQIDAFSDLATLEPHPAALPFEPLTFWSDEASKLRWIFIPNDGTHDQPDEQIGFSESDPWTFPIGTVLMKHFELDLDQSSDGGSIRLETRFLVRAEDGSWYGVTYRWRPDHSDADLLTTGETQDYTVQLDDGSTRDQTWTFPSRSQCLICHNTGEGGPAGPGTHQLNRDLRYPATGRTDNQLRTWNGLGIFSPPLVEADIPSYLSARSVNDASAPIELRARSYIDTNCGYCHRPETGNRAAFDGRLSTPLPEQGLVWGGVLDPLGLIDPSLVFPGDPSRSLIFHRTALMGPGAMPPLAKGVVDSEGLALLDAWIRRVDPGFPRPGLRYEYYEEIGLTALPDFDQRTPVATGSTAGFDISLRQRDDDFAFRFSGVLEIPFAGDWTFHLTSDEGSQLWLDGTLVVDHDGLHAATEKTGTISLSAGFHDVVVTMFEASGSEVLNVGWEGPSTPLQPVPASRLFQQTPTPIVNQAPLLEQPADQSSVVGDAIALAMVGSDPDGDLPYFSAEGLPGGLSIDPETGLIAGVLGIGSPGVHRILVGLSDGPAVATVAFDWTVSDPISPTVSMIAPTEGSSVRGVVLVRANAEDAGGVAGVQFLLDGVPLGAEDVSAPYEISWNTTQLSDGSYELSAVARDGAGNTALSSPVRVTVDSAPVAAWSFDEGSGSVATDATGNGHQGTVSGATWTTSGYFGGALAFSGASHSVLVPDADGLDLTGPMTISAWVYSEQIMEDWASIVQKETDAYFLHAYSFLGVAGAGITGGAGCCTLVWAPSATPLGAWTHLAMTFDGSQLIYYRNGAPIGTTAASGPVEVTSSPLWIGNNSFGENFVGSIDEVRIYDRALDALEIQADMVRSIAPQGPDTTSPTVSLTSPASGPVAGVVVLGADALDDVGVVGVQFLLDGSPLGPEDPAPPYEFVWDTSSLPNGPYVLSAEARDGAGNTGAAADVAVSVENVPDSTDPTVTIASPLDGSTLVGSVQIQASASDDVGVVGVQFLLEGAPLGIEDLVAPFEFLWNTRLESNGPYALSAIVRDAAGNTAFAPEVIVQVENALVQPVAAWGFDEESGALALDATGAGHDGTIEGALRIVDGRFGSALLFDGIQDVVVVPDSEALALGDGFTLSAWVRPTLTTTAWAAIAQKATDAWFLHASSLNGRPAAGATLADVCCTQVVASQALPTNVWSHLAATYDGIALRYFVDGVLVGSTPASGGIQVTAGELRFGNNTYGEGFAGAIDELRIYDRALDPAELDLDRATPVPEPDGLWMLVSGAVGLVLLGRSGRRCRSGLHVGADE